MPNILGVNHLHAVRALEKAGGLRGPSSFIIPGWNDTSRPVSKAFVVEQVKGKIPST